MFIHTLFPEPVAPATSICGILAISATITLPPISIPTPKAISTFDVLKALLSIISLKLTTSLVSFGISMPISDFPGIGASILIV